MKAKRILGVMSVVVAVIMVTTAVAAAGCAAPEKEVAPGEEIVPKEEVTPEEEATPEVLEPIKVGLPLSMTGWYAEDGQYMHDAAILAIEEINAAGGLLGRLLEPIIFDVENQQAEKIIAAAEKLIGGDKVDVLITGYAGIGVDVEYFGKYDVPFFNGNASDRCVEMVIADPSKNNVFQVDDMTTGFARVSAEFLLGLPYNYPSNKIASITMDDEWSLSFSGVLQETLINEGWESVMYETASYGTREWGPILTKIRGLDPAPAIIHLESLAAEEGITFVQQFLEDPTDSLIWLGYGFTLPGYERLMGEEGDGLMGFSWFYVDTEKGRAYAQHYEEMWGYEPPGSIPGWVYDAVYIWAEAVKRVGDPSDYAAVIKAIQDYPYEGALGLFEFVVPGNYAPTDADLPTSFVQLQGGEYTIIYRHLTPESGVEFLVPPWIK